MKKGILFILIAEFCFAASSVVAKWVLKEPSLSGIQITFFRFLLGSIISFILLKKSGESFIPNKPQMVWWRAFFNTISAMLFFFSLKYTTVTNANMLGLTYPLWVVIFAPILIKETFEIRNLVFVIIALFGVYLIVHPSFNSINLGDICAFGAGVTASIAVIALRQARKYDSTNIIIFYLMTTGLVINGILLAPVWSNPDILSWVLIIISALLGFLAQILITHGYKYIEATRGSLISSSRVIMAGAMGVIFFSDQITIQIIAGAILILSSQYAMILKKFGIKRQ
ncbi:MAG: DMT family transporter [Marinilabiliaceae bacterium]|nr:DMT family transporter [Marinilabiliaceae bacterium]